MIESKRFTPLLLVVLAATLTLSSCGDDSTNASGALSVTCSVTPVTGPVPLRIAYTATIQSSTPPNSVFVEYGDGLTETASTSGGHVYTAPGGYGLRFTATLAGGQSATCGQTVTALPESAGPPNAVPVLRLKTNPNPARGTAPLNVNFNTCTSSDADGERLLHVYDYGDGRKTDELNDCGKDHVYAAGKYTANICVTDGRAGHQVCSAVDVVAQ